MKGFMSKFYWEDMVMYWARRGIPKTPEEWLEYDAVKSPSKKENSTPILWTGKAGCWRNRLLD
jgi:hypothetical protein